MKQLFILLFLFMLLGQLKLFAMERQEIPGIKGKELTGLELLEDPTQPEKVQAGLNALFRQIFAKDDILKESFGPKERVDWLAALSQFTAFVDSKPEEKKDRNILSAYQSVINVFSQLVDIQPKLVRALGTLRANADHKGQYAALKLFASAHASIGALEKTLEGFVLSMTDVINRYETLSKKRTAKSWSADKKEVWNLINILAEFAKAAAQNLIQNLQKSKERALLGY